MRIEFIGLPGSGKTSVLTQLDDRLRAAGHDSGGLRELSKIGAAQEVQSVKFLRRRAERTNLYGSFEFRRANPEIFDLLCANQANIPELTLWTMDMLAQLHFVAPLVVKGSIVLCDEGLMQRGVANFAGRNDVLQFEFYNRLLPKDFLVVHLSVPIDLAMERATSRTKGLPIERWYKDRDPRDVMEEKRRLIKLACGVRRDRGLPVIEIDARAPIAETADKLTSDVLDLMNLAQPAPKKQPKRSKQAA